MSHRNFLEDQILDLLKANPSWHSEPELEDFLERQGYDLDLVQDMIDKLITAGEVDFETDPSSGLYMIATVHGAATHA